MNKIMLVDGNNILARAAFAADHSPMNVEGINTGAVHIFVTMLSKYVRLIRPTHLVLMWDGGHTYRDQISSDYKAGRPKHEGTEEHGFRRLALEFCVYANIPCMKVDGWEADDLIAAAVRSNPGSQIAIVSGDKDLMQLIRRDAPPRVGGVVQYKVPDDIPWTFERFYTEKEMYPRDVPNWMAMVGDTSDGIVGVKGLGPKKATALLKEAKWEWTSLVPLLGPERATQAATARSLVDLLDIDYPERLWKYVDNIGGIPWDPTDINQVDPPMFTKGRVVGLQMFLDHWQLASLKARLEDGSMWLGEEFTPPQQDISMADIE